MKVSKCCGAEVEEKTGAYFGYICTKCKFNCETIEQDDWKEIKQTIFLAMTDRLYTDKIAEIILNNFINELLKDRDEKVLIWLLNNIHAFEEEWKNYRGEKTKGEYLIQRYKELVK